MTVISWNYLNRPRPEFAGPVRLTIGVFDGLHIGHRRLMEGVVRGSGEGIPLVITFRQSPAVVLAPGSFPGFILSYEQKLARLESLGIRAVVVIDFSREMSNLSGKAFIALLKEKLAIEKIVVGHNFRFGKGRNAGTDDLKEMLSTTGTEVQVTEPVLWGDSIVSSSRIRKTIKDAEFSEAKAMLAADYGVDLRGIPTDTIQRGVVRIARGDLTQVVPKPGIYQVLCAGRAGQRPGELTVGEEFLTVAAADCNDITTVFFQ
jgi:riboflavin kinase / FMN adenylyltransferase